MNTIVNDFAMSAGSRDGTASSSRKTVAVVIPALDPDERLVEYCEDLRAMLGEESPILLVNDGSRKETVQVFDHAEAKVSNISVVSHPRNLGKGRALKTAFSELLNQFAEQCVTGEFVGCVTADADGQHSVFDVYTCANSLKSETEALVLGCRNFDGLNVPWRSSFGNNWMRTLFALASGRRFYDTQTGLRGIPTSFMRELLNVPGDRFEFESEMLLRLGERPLVQFPIRTIYENGNRSSHFRPFADSAMVLHVLIRPILIRLLSFSLASAVSFVVDIGLFSFLQILVFTPETPGRLFWSIAIARCFSVIFNYFCNRLLVFHPHTMRSSARCIVGQSLPRYALLAVAIMILSWLLTKMGTAIAPMIPIPVVKATADLFLFMASYSIQSIWVFRP